MANSITLHLWDTAGSESSRAMLPLYYRDSSAALITYDIGSMRSFEHLDYWANELTQKLTPNTYVRFCLTTYNKIICFIKISSND